LLPSQQKLEVNHIALVAARIGIFGTVLADAVRERRETRRRLELDGHRRRIRRGGYPSRKAALEVLARRRSPRPGDGTDGVVTVGDWLAHWLVSRTSPAASTVRGYAARIRLSGTWPTCDRSAEKRVVAGVVNAYHHAA
jgi:hypothetical protein